MAQNRKEMTSAEQLVELRKARDRYKALADSFRKEGDALAGRVRVQGDPLCVMEEKLKRERDARRIANAYEKSIANIVARSEAMRQAQTSMPRAGSEPIKLLVLVLFVVIGGAAFLAAGYPEIYQRARDYFSDRREIAAQPAPAQTPAAPVMAAPQPAAPAGRRARTAPRAASSLATVPLKKRPAIKKTAVAPPTREDDGFVVKVLQPDGTLKEQFFKARPD
jgi:hypothetical protein